MSGDDPYTYPASRVLRNNLDLRDPVAFDRAERRLVVQRIREGVPRGDFDLAHLKAIHRHLFQDVYSWAGEVRSVEVSKGGNQFQFRQYIETGMADVHRRIVGNDYFRGLSAKDFAARAGTIMGDVNYVHPFREGNGRTQLQYLKQLGEKAEHMLDLTKLRPELWLEASREAHGARYDAMGRAIAETIVPAKERDHWQRREKEARTAIEKRSGPVRTALTLGLDDDFETSLAALGKLRNKFAHEIETTLIPAAVDSFAGALGPRAKRAVQYTYSTLRAKFPGKPESIRDLDPKDRMGVYLITIHQALVYETAIVRERRAHGAQAPE